ncbi:MAG: hypothetical protein IJ326_07650 [Lachnospiraceae bacterium]|nr:hypothetical protein [Lachnospiraceae bacterium]
MNKEVNQETGFTYTYSAKQQKEIEEIKRKYNLMPPDTTEAKMAQLRRLDQSAERPGTIWALVLGIVGTLVFGTGMSLAMVWTNQFLLLGILVGVIGIVILALAYPVYKMLTKRQRERIAPQILALTEELLK